MEGLTFMVELKIFTLLERERDGEVSDDRIRTSHVAGWPTCGGAGSSDCRLWNGVDSVHVTVARGPSDSESTVS